MTRPVAVTIMVVLALVLLAAMWWGWRRRVARTAVGLGEVVHAVSQTASEPAAETGTEAPAGVRDVPGVYVTSTSAGDWLDRIGAQGLGARSSVRVDVREDGVLLRRGGAPDVFVPREDLVGVSRARGMAGKFVERDGLVVLRWRLGERELDTGIRTKLRADRPRLVEAIGALVEAPPTPSVDKSEERQ